MTTTTGTTVNGQREVKFENGTTVTFFNGKFIILNANGVIFDDKYNTEEQAMQRVKQLFNF
jgi:hypothetical protein